MTQPWLWALAGIGGIVVLRLLDAIVDFLQFHFSPTPKALQAYKRDGSEPTYALITGASAGIGFGIARELVKLGFGVILLGHLEDELDEAATRLRQIGGADGDTKAVHVKTIVMDARTATPAEITAAVQSTIEDDGLQVSILVNNVGSNPITLPAFRPMATYSTGDVDVVIDMNARFMARLTAIMLPILSRRHTGEGFAFGTHQRSLILNTSSEGMAGTPWLVMYSATKAFNWSLSVALARELEADPETRHVDCLAVIPGDVLSQGNRFCLSKWAPDANTFAKCVVERTDGALRRGMREMRPYWLHDLQNRIWEHVLGEGTRTKEVTKMVAKKRDAFNAADGFGVVDDSNAVKKDA